MKNREQVQGLVQVFYSRCGYRSSRSGAAAAAGVGVAGTEGGGGPPVGT